MVCSLFHYALMTFTILSEDGHFATHLTAAYAGKRAVVVRREVHELVHEALAEALELVSLLLPCDIIVKSEYMQESQQRKRLMPWPVSKSFIS